MASFRHRSLREVAGPLWIENILRTALITVDVFMLTFYSEKAVAAVGLINQFVFFLQLMYLIVTSGVSILLAQYLGAERTESAHQTALASFVLVVAFALVLSLGLSLGAPAIVGLYALDPAVHDFAIQFLVIYASGSVFVAVSMLQSTLLRVHGDARTPMYVSVAVNGVNIAGNSLVLFGWFGFPVLGVAGVACSTVVAQALGCAALNVAIRRDRHILLDFKRLRAVNGDIYRRILRVGIPTAGENLSYNLAQIVNMRFVAVLGTSSMAAYAILNTFLRLVFISSVSIGSAVQIKVGWWVGQGQEDTAAERTLRYFVVGTLISLTMIVFLNLLQQPLFGLFTRNPETLAIIGSVLLVSLFMEPGRNFNIILIPALKGAGDVRFPAVIGVLFMWGIGVLGAWLLGIVFGLGLRGVYLALCLDEWGRGLCMLARWRSGKWRGRGFVGGQG